MRWQTSVAWILDSVQPLIAFFPLGPAGLSAGFRRRTLRAPHRNPALAVCSLAHREKFSFMIGHTSVTSTICGWAREAPPWPKNEHYPLNLKNRAPPFDSEKARRLIKPASTSAIARVAQMNAITAQIIDLHKLNVFQREQVGDLFGSVDEH